MRGKMMGFAMAGAVIGALGAVPAAAQGTFEGMVTYKMTMPEGKTAVMRYYQLGSRLRQEYDMQGQTAATITDGTTGDMITLMPQQKKYLVMNLKESAKALGPMARALGGNKQQPSADLSKLKITATGRRETIAGISCEHYLMVYAEKQNTPPVDMCVATGMGFMGSPYQGGAAMGAAGMAGSPMPSTAAMLKAANPEFARLMRQGFFPLKTTMSDGGKQVVMEATAIDRRRPAASLFAPPPDYTKLDIAGMMQRKP